MALAEPFWGEATLSTPNGDGTILLCGIQYVDGTEMGNNWRTTLLSGTAEFIGKGPAPGYEA